MQAGQAGKYREVNILNEDSVDQRLKIADERIQWVLEHPGMSQWIKNALHTSYECNPVDLLNDIEMLNTILRQRAEALVDRSLGHSRQTKSGNPDDGFSPGSKKYF